MTEKQTDTLLYSVKLPTSSFDVALVGQLDKQV